MLWGAALGLDNHDAKFGKRDDPVTTTVTVFTRYTLTETTMTTITPAASMTSASTPIVTVTSTEMTTTTTTAATTITTVSTSTTTIEPTKTESSDDKRKRDGGGSITITSTTTVWEFPDATETSTVTVTELPVPTKESSNALPTTTTEVTTEISTVTEVTTTTTTSLATSTVSASPTTSKISTALILDGDHDGLEDIKGKAGPHTGTILGATFGAVIGAICVFVAAYLWAKNRRDEKFGKGASGIEAQEAGGSAPLGGRGVTGMLLSILYLKEYNLIEHSSTIGLIGSVLGSTRSTARYNTLPNSENSSISLANRSTSFPPPQHSPPPQLPAVHLDPPYPGFNFPSYSNPPQNLPSLHIIPPSESEFTYEYTFGSPVSSIGEAQLHALTNGELSDSQLPPLPRSVLDELEGVSPTSEPVRMGEVSGSGIR